MKCAIVNIIKGNTIHILLSKKVLCMCVFSNWDENSEGVDDMGKTLTNESYRKLNLSAGKEISVIPKK